MRPFLDGVDGVFVGEALPQAIGGEDEEEVEGGGEDVRGYDGFARDVGEVWSEEGMGGGREDGDRSGKTETLARPSSLPPSLPATYW